MKGILMLNKIIPFLLLALMLEASQIPRELKYHINLQQQFKGVLIFQNTNQKTNVEYYNITPRDKIPFYAQKKEFQLTHLQDKPTLEKLNVQNSKKRIVYDLTTLSEDALEEADISQEDVASSSIIYNADDLPSEIIEKRIVHTMESLILSIFETNKIYTKPFYLYEPHKNMLIKVIFKHTGKSNITLNSKVCTSDTYVLQIEGRNKRLVRIYTNGYPLKVESFSKKWSFELAGVGESKRITLKNSDIAFAVYKDALKQKYKQYNIKILSQKVQNDGFSTNYITTFHVEKELPDKVLQSALIHYTKNNANMHYAQTKKEAFAFSVSADEVLDLFEKQYELEDEKHYWKKESKRISSKELLQYVAKKRGCFIPKMGNGKTIKCNKDEEEVNFEDALKEYYAKHYEDYAVEDLIEIKNNFDDIVGVSYTLKTLQKLDDNILSKFATIALQKKYPTNGFKNPLQFIKTRDSWNIYIDKKSVQQYACKTFIPGVKSSFKNGLCEATAQSIHSSQDTKDIVSRYLQQHYKDLFVLNTPIEYGETTVSFSYLNDLSKVENACH